MANVLHRSTGQYRQSAHTPDYDPVNWIINPDVSAVADVPLKYWKISGDTVSAMIRAERDVVDAAEIAAAIAAEKEAAKANLRNDRLTTALVTVMSVEDRAITKRSLAAVIAAVETEIDGRA